MASYEELIAEQLEEERIRKEAAALERDKQLQLMLDEYQAPIDLSPLAAPLDLIYGGNLSQALKPKQDEQADLINQLLKEERAEPKGSSGLLRSSLSGKSRYTGEQPKDAKELRSEWLQNKTTKDTQEVLSAYEKVKKSSTGGAANDISLIFGYMKMLDPGSVVREGEFANAQNAAGVPDRVKNLYNRVANGERLNPDQRKEFVDSAELTYQGQLEQQNRLNQEYEDLSNSYGVDPKVVVRRGLFKAPQVVDEKKKEMSPTGPSGAMSFEEFKASRKK